MAKQRVQCSSHELDPHKNTQWAKLEIQQTLQLHLKIHKNIAFRFQNKSQGFLLMLIEAIKPENFTNFPELILCNFLTSICESSTHDLCVLPLQICKVKCDWFLSADVTEIVLMTRVRRCYFRRRQPTAGNTSAFAGYLSYEFISVMKITRIFRII